MKYLAIYIVNTDPVLTTYDANCINCISDFEAVSIEKWSQAFPRVTATGLIRPVNFGYGRVTSQKSILHLYSQYGTLDINYTLPLALAYDKQHNIHVLSYMILVDVKYYVFRAGHKLLDLETRTFKPYPEGHLYVEMAKEQIADFRKIVPDAHYVVAVVNHDDEKAMPMDKLYDALDIPSSIKLIPCDTTDKTSVKNVLLELLKSQEQTDDVKEAIHIIEKQ